MFFSHFDAIFCLLNRCKEAKVSSGLAKYNFGTLTVRMGSLAISVQEESLFSPTKKEVFLSPLSGNETRRPKIRATSFLLSPLKSPLTAKSWPFFVVSTLSQFDTSISGKSPIFWW